MFPSISYEYTSKSQDTTLKTRSLSYHASFLEAPVEYHPLVVPRHYGKYHPNHYILSKLSSLRKNFAPYQYPSVRDSMNTPEPHARPRISFQTRLT
ncbi:hypothetical protein QL285_069851 [Trifolium repens]|nr:hypothetical protein QL285_069851 [Trifolium repens]